MSVSNLQGLTIAGNSCQFKLILQPVLVIMQTEHIIYSLVTGREIHMGKNALSPF